MMENKKNQSTMNRKKKRFNRKHFKMLQKVIKQ